jgi:regulatory protein YycH of two-component signal transduction system YycFG
MKREFLQGLKVGEMSLPKEVIDAIMAENGRDIEGVKARYADYEALQEQLAQAETEAAKHWEEKLNNQVDTHRREMSELIFSHNLEKAILAVKGRNAKAITALLDIDSLKVSENQTADLEAALQNLKQDCSYLFQSETPPPYARGTGANQPEVNKSPATLAGALLEKFERK